MPRIINLRAEDWRTLDVNARLAALQDLENRLAMQESRDPCTVRLIPEAKYSSAGEKERLRGFHVYENKDIFINDRLVSADQPYEATETLFHEARHAYQQHVAQQRPDLAADPAQLEDFQKNYGPGYLSPERDGPAYYLWQPTEKDARAIGRERTEQLYGQEFADKTGYLRYRQQREGEEASYRLRGENLGSNYEELARQKAYDRYAVLQQARQQDRREPSLAEPNQEHASELTETAPSKQATPASQPRAAELTPELGEDYEHSQGYGY